MRELQFNIPPTHMVGHMGNGLKSHLKEGKSRGLKLLLMDWKSCALSTTLQLLVKEVVNQGMAKSFSTHKKQVCCNIWKM